MTVWGNQYLLNKWYLSATLNGKQRGYEINKCFQIVDKGDVEQWVGDLIACHVSFDSLIELEDEQRRLTRADKSKWGESWKTKRNRERRGNRTGPPEVITVTNPTAVLRLLQTDLTEHDWLG